MSLYGAAPPVIELGDGQVSALPVPELRQQDVRDQLDAEVLYRNLAEHWPPAG